MDFYKQIIFLLFIIISVVAQSQIMIINSYEYKIKDPQTISGKVFYDLVYLKDTTQPDHPYKETYELDFGKTESMFISYSQKLSDSAMYADLEKQVATAPDPNHLSLTLRGNSFVSNEMYFTNDSVPFVYVLKPIASALFYIKDTASKIDWKILDSTKSIKGRLCQKAVGENHGRTYVAWFCSDLPYSFGPRKLNGLPGLILEAYDTKREVVYNFNRFMYPVQGQIGLPQDAMPATDAEYKKTMDAFRKNPMVFSNATAIKRNTPLDNIDPTKIKQISVFGENPYGKDVHLSENNPIDLK